MTSTALALLPTDGDASTWSAQERALVEAAGLVRTVNKQTGEQVLADRPTVEAFLVHCRRTGLDPIARQIYAIYRAGKWGIQISIDGARLVAERTGTYEGQTTPQFTSDGTNWTEVWLSPEPPKAARVGVYRRGFREPLYAVALWDAYAVMQDEWVNNSKTGKQVVSAMWKKMGPLMLAKCAEMLALRKAFPQDLAGLYSTEEMDQAGAPLEVVRQVEKPAQPVTAPVAIQQAALTRDWVLEVGAASTLEELNALANEAQALGEVGLVIDDEHGAVIDVLRKRRGEVQAAAETPVLDGVKVTKSGRRQWVREARGMQTRVQVHALYQEAVAAGALAQVIEELEAIERTLPDPDAEKPAEGGDWPAEEAPEDGWTEVSPGVFAEAAAVEAMGPAGVLDDSFGGEQ